MVLMQLVCKKTLHLREIIESTDAINKKHSNHCAR